MFTTSVGLGGKGSAVATLGLLNSTDHVQSNFVCILTRQLHVVDPVNCPGAFVMEVGLKLGCGPALKRHPDYFRIQHPLLKALLHCSKLCCIAQSSRL